MSKLKVIVIGPQETGKTFISNILADFNENDYLQYEPTEGVRILEIEIKTKYFPEKNVEIELWDCAGSQRFQSCWPIIQLEAEGIIFVYDNEAADQLLELELLYDYFVIQNGLNNWNCMIFINQKNNVLESSRILPRRFNDIPQKIINAANNPNGVRSEFSNFIEILLNNLNKTIK